MLQKYILSILLTISCGASATSKSEYFAPGFRINGESASDISIDWWKWAMSAPTQQNPVLDKTGANCGVAQKGPIWFLAGGFGASKIIRRCTIPQGKFIFFPVINMVYWPRRPNNGYTCAQAEAHAAVNNDADLELHVVLDGTPLKSPKAYRAKSTHCFNMFADVPARYHAYNAFPSASDGYWILLRPLPPGHHLLKFSGRYNSPGTPYGKMVQDIEYKIDVR